jgi:SLT domain-containing protein
MKIAFVIMLFTSVASAAWRDDHELTPLLAAAALRGGTIIPWTPATPGNLECFIDGRATQNMTIANATNVTELTESSVNAHELYTTSEANAPQWTTNFGGSLRFNLTRSTSSATYDWLIFAQTNIFDFIHTGGDSTVAILVRIPRGTNDIQSIYNHKQGSSTDRGADIYMESRNSAARTNGLLAQTATRAGAGLTTSVNDNQVFLNSTPNLLVIRWSISTNTVVSNRLVYTINGGSKIYNNTLDFAPTASGASFAPRIGAHANSPANPLKDAYLCYFMVWSKLLSDEDETALQTYTMTNWEWTP